jgi:outer membrane lipoprotein
MKWLIYILPVFLIACSSLPKAIQDPPSDDLQLENVAGQVAGYVNNPIRWGGKIITVNNDNEQSILQIVQFPLNSFGRPVEGKDSQGRFLIQSAQFLDPEVYKPGCLATFTGIIHSEQQRVIDKKTLYLPVVQMAVSHLWSKKQQHIRPYYDGYYLYPHQRYGYFGRRYFAPHRYYH